MLDYLINLWKRKKKIQQKEHGKYTTIETDPYQGNIRQFIMDVAETMTDDVRENIQLDVQKEKKPISQEDEYVI